ncbi:MAG TPA: DNA polymerase III subunit delta [Syntrophales bacterium]|nr:DNA polymerase III subunit delta [Syntrophales bacterium]
MSTQLGETTETLEKVLNSIKKGMVAPCYLLYGDEEYLLQDAFNKIVDLLLPAADRAFNLFIMEGGQENVNDICLSLLTVPLIPGRKIVALRNTTIFQSRKILPTLVQNIRDHLDSNPLQVAGDFLQFLKLTGWKLADLQDGGWKNVSDEEWRKTVEGDRGEDREKWLPKAIDLCAERGVDSRAVRDDSGGLGKILSSGLPEGNHLILTAQAVDKRKQLFKQIEEVGTVLFFSRAKGEAKQKFMLVEMAQELLAEKGKRLTPDAWQAIGGKTGFELRKSMLALEKLIVYTGDRPTIEAGDVEEVTGKTKEITVFDLTSALVERNLPQTLVILKDLLEQGVHHLVIMKMLTREVRLLLYAVLLLMSGKLASYTSHMDFSRFQASVYPDIKALAGKEKDGLGSLAGQHPYVMYKLLKSSEKFSYNALIGHMEYLAEMDLSLRSTGKDPKLMLERFLMEVCLN